MRLRHKKWADKVFLENKDIARNLSDFNEEEIKSFNHLEIGSGQGGFLIEVSKLKPEEKYLGVEVNRNAFAMAVKHASLIKDDHHNFLLLNAPIERLFPLFKEEQLDTIYLNFSDPWPKKKQHHRRLTYPTIQKEYYKILKPSGKLYFRTDNIDLFNDSIEYFKETNLFDIEIIQPFDSHAVSFLPPTEYENKFRAQGVAINLLIATKK